MKVRLAAAILSALALAGAVALANREEVDEPPWMAHWRAGHADPRPASDQGLAQHLRTRARQRRDDLLALAVAVAAGAGWIAARGAGGGSAALARRALLAGGLVLGGVAAARSLAAVVDRATDERWDAGDDALVAQSGALAEVVRAWRAEIDPRDPVIFVGLHAGLLNRLSWALFPRPLYHLPWSVPRNLGPQERDRWAAALLEGRPAPARWWIDLAALDRGAGRDALHALPWSEAPSEPSDPAEPKGTRR